MVWVEVCKLLFSKHELCSQEFFKVQNDVDYNEQFKRIKSAKRNYERPVRVPPNASVSCWMYEWIRASNPEKSDSVKKEMRNDNIFHLKLSFSVWRRPKAPRKRKKKSIVVMQKYQPWISYDILVWLQAAVSKSVSIKCLKYIYYNHTKHASNPGCHHISHTCTHTHTHVEGYSITWPFTSTMPPLPFSNVSGTPNKGIS